MQDEIRVWLEDIEKAVCELLKGYTFLSVAGKSCVPHSK